MGLFRANETNRWNRIPTGKRQTSWLCTRATEQLNQGLPKMVIHHPAGDQSGNWKLGISRIQAQRPNHSVMIWSGITVWITQKGTWSNHNDDGNRNPTNLHISQWKTVFFARFAGAYFIFWHFEDVLVLSTTWNDLFCSCVDDVSIWWQMFNFVFLCPKRYFQFNSRIEHIFQA